MTTHSTDSYANALDAYRRGDLLEARTCLERVALDSSSYAEARHLLAVLLAREQRFAEAESNFLAAIRNAPARYDFRCNYALLLHDSGESEQAAALFDHVLQIQPNFAPALNGLGNALHRLGDLAGSERALRRAVQAQPGNALHHNNLGNVLKERGVPVEAISCYQKALSLYPDYAEAQFNLGVALKDQDRHEEARAHFRQALQIRPDYLQATEQLQQVADFWLAPLVGKSVVLRRYCERDAAFLFATFRNADFMAHYNRMIPAGDPLKKLAAALRKSEQSLPWRNRSVDWVIHLKGARETERPIGLVNLADLDLQNKRAEYLYGIVDRQEYHARYALEAFLLAMDFAFNQARLNKTTSIVYEGNPDAQSLTLQLGFKQEGFRPRHMHVPGKGYLGLFENGMNVEDFRSNKRLANLSLRWLGKNVTDESHM